MKFIIKSFLVIMFFTYCTKDVDPHRLCVFKTKGDYTKNVKVYLDKDLKKINAVLDGNFKPVKLINGFVADIEAWYPYSNYLIITYDEYNNKYKRSISNDSMMKLLVDPDPYLEFYECDDYRENFSTENGYYGIDTAKLNDIILKGELTKYFKKLK
jgi:hypothetical protein